MFENKHLVLASSSPRRKDLLERAGVAFTTRLHPVQEDFPENIPAEEVPVYLAEKKARATQSVCMPDELVLAADTVVLLGGRMIGKPENEAHAREILQSLSGRMHHVISGVCLLRGNRMKTFAEMTNVYFRKLSEGQINDYIRIYAPMDKAGAYAIQEWIGLVGVEKIEGDYFNVVGLPIGKVIKEIEAF